MLALCGTRTKNCNPGPEMELAPKPPEFKAEVSKLTPQPDPCPPRAHARTPEHLVLQSNTNHSRSQGVQDSGTRRVAIGVEPLGESAVDPLVSTFATGTLMRD
mmetsp:Transcript_12552/g.19750  ORF Transcript_12552/g.19750 Transcript_12552/m.19750 type:complete len:103 (-) Transcript_12552:358-666(-)